MGSGVYFDLTIGIMAVAMIFAITIAARGRGRLYWAKPLCRNPRYTDFVYLLSILRAFPYNQALGLAASSVSEAVFH